MSLDKKKLDKIREEKPFLPLTDIVHELILQEIISFRLNPGDRISESTIAETLGISRSPVKSALERLEKNGFIDVASSRYYIATFDEKEYNDIYETTMMIEPFAAGLAALNVTDEELEKMTAMAEEIHELYKQAARSGSKFGFNKLLEAEMEFHYAVIKASKNKLLIEMYEQVRDTLWHYRGYLLFTRPDGFYDTIDTDHSLICKMLRLHDRELAEAIMSRHVNISREGISRFGLLEPYTTR